MSATILLVEDEADLRQLVGFNLRKEGHRVLEAADGVEALQQLEGGPVDMVIADVMMPRMDGLELCARLQERPELEGVPFLFVTAKGGADAQYVGLRAGADDYIAKPFELSDLLARVRGRLERQARARARGVAGSPPADPTLTRWCPVCGRRVRASICPDDGVETLAPPALRGLGGGLEPGSVVGGRYRVERPLGSGAMGNVYEATQLSIGRRVALKVLHGSALRDETEIRRFHQEARAASRLDHPNVVTVVDFGVDEGTGTPFLAMALLEGRTLRDELDRGPMATEEALHILTAVARGLAAAHAVGVVHRDLKPENVMVRRAHGERQVTVLDFGVAKLPRRADEVGHLTGRGEIVGTPRSMSPEQVRGGSVGPSSDLYGLGCLLHEMLTGGPPFRAESAAGLLLEHLHTPVPELPDRLGDETVPSAELRALHRQLLAKTPEGRPASAHEVVRRASGLVGSAPSTELEDTDPIAELPAARPRSDDPEADTEIREAIASTRPRAVAVAIATAIAALAIGLIALALTAR